MLRHCEIVKNVHTYSDFPLGNMVGILACLKRLGMPMWFDLASEVCPRSGTLDGGFKR